MYKRLREDIDSVLQRDPAAGSRLSVFFLYPGLHALIAFRMAHWLWTRRMKTLGLLLSYIARMVTGIEIHPGATIGRRFFIDHGMGVVIGGTAEIGDDVTLYQGVTLGGTSLKPGKRHPTLRDGVIVGANATILGPVTIDEYARVGANAVVLKDVPSDCTAVGVPARVIRAVDREAAHRFVPYGTPCDDLPDPVARTICTLRDEINSLRHRLDALDGADAGEHLRPQEIADGGKAPPEWYEAEAGADDDRIIEPAQPRDEEQTRRRAGG